MINGRLTATLGPRTQRVAFGTSTGAELVAELNSSTTVDLAHVVMLVRSGLLSQQSGAALLRYITALRDSGFEPLLDLPAPRGTYLMYETHLIDQLGVETGARLHTGRSRNDLKATTTAVELREHALDLVGECVRLQAVLLSRARAAANDVMPIYTHFQAAMPVSYGHYLLGIALCLDRDIAALRHAADGLRRCPLGAGAVAGTDLPIDTALTASLLGFDSPATHSTDAVACRDVALRLTGAASGAALTLSRLATDLQLWSTAEFELIEFPDRLVGGSSAMPQKRNAFLLEHVKAKAGTAIGAWTAGASATKSTPFTNSIEVGTEAVSNLWPGLHATLDSVLLAQVLVSGARLVRERAADRAEEGFVTATALANRLVTDGVPFRSAHQIVGDAVRRAIERGDTRLGELESPPGMDLAEPADRSTAEVMSEHRFGGGPGDFEDPFAAVHDELVDHHLWCRAWRERLATGQRDLTSAVVDIMDAQLDG